MAQRALVAEQEITDDVTRSGLPAYCPEHGCVRELSVRGPRRIRSQNPALGGRAYTRALNSCPLESDTGFDFGVLESHAADGQLNVAKFLHFGEQDLFFESQPASENHAVQQAQFNLMAQRQAKLLAGLLRRLQSLLLPRGIAISAVGMLDQVHISRRAGRSE
jgi:hypothetical protein